MKKFQRTQTDRPPAGWSTTTLRVHSAPFSFLFKVESHVSKRMRRAMVLQTFRALKPVFRDLEKCEIYHSDGTWINWIRNPAQEPSFRQTPQFGTSQQNLGVEIRMRRLAAALTLAELAFHSGISVKHLGKIEHGRHQPKAETLERIAHALKTYTRNPQ